MKKLLTLLLIPMFFACSVSVGGDVVDDVVEEINDEPSLKKLYTKQLVEVEVII